MARKIIIAIVLAAFAAACYPQQPQTRTCPTANDAAARYLTPEDFALCSCLQLDGIVQETFARQGQAGMNGWAAENINRIRNYQASAGCSAPPAPPPTTTAQRPEPRQPPRPAAQTNRPSARPAPQRPTADPVEVGSGCPMWPDQMNRHLGPNELQYCTCSDLDLLRNEIYARHGRIFNRQDLQNYFSAQPWYAADPNNRTGERGQNQFERSNATAILNYEKAAGCRQSAPASTGSSSGCPSWPAQASRNLTASELQFCTCRELELRRNEIYARHGRVFNRQDLQNYFASQSWYSPDYNNIDGDRGQNQYERSNATYILNYEKSAGCRK